MIPRNHVRMAMVIPVTEKEPEKLIAAIDSVRKQTRVPLHIRIVDHSNWITANSEVATAIANLRKFCPDVVVMTFGYYAGIQSPNTIVYKDLEPRDYDVLVTMEPNIVLREIGLHLLTLPFYTPGTLWEYGSLIHIEATDHWWNRLGHKNRISYRLSACHKSVITDFLK